MMEGSGRGEGCVSITSLADVDFLYANGSAERCIAQLKQVKTSIQSGGSVRRDDIEFSTKLLQSVCALNESRSRSQMYLNTLLECLSTIECFTRRGVKVDISIIIMKAMAFCAERGFTETALLLSYFYFTSKTIHTFEFFSSQQQPQLKQQLHRLHQEEQLPLNSVLKDKEKTLFLLVSRVKLLLKMLEDNSYTTSTNNLHQTVQATLASISEVLLLSDFSTKNNVKPSPLLTPSLQSFAKEHAFLNHKTIIHSITNDVLTIDFTDIRSFYFNRYSDQSISADSLTAMLIEALTVAKKKRRKPLNSFEIYLLQQTVIGVLSDVFLLLPSSPSPSSASSKLMNAKSFSGLLEVLCFQLEDEHLQLSLARILETSSSESFMRLPSILLRVTAQLKLIHAGKHKKPISGSIKNHSSFSSSTSSSSSFSFAAADPRFSKASTVTQNNLQEQQLLSFSQLSASIYSLTQQQKNHVNQRQGFKQLNEMLGCRVFNQIQELKNDFISKQIEPQKVLEIFEQSHSSATAAARGASSSNSKRTSPLYSTSQSSSSMTSSTADEEESRNFSNADPTALQDILESLHIQNSLILIIDSQGIDVHSVITQNHFTSLIYSLHLISSSQSIDEQALLDTLNLILITPLSPSSSHQQMRSYHVEFLIRIAAAALQRRSQQAVQQQQKAIHSYDRLSCILLEVLSNSLQLPSDARLVLSLLNAFSGERIPSLTVVRLISQSTTQLEAEYQMMKQKNSKELSTHFFEVLALLTVVYLVEETFNHQESYKQVHASEPSSLSTSNKILPTFPELLSRLESLESSIPSEIKVRYLHAALDVTSRLLFSRKFRKKSALAPSSMEQQSLRYSGSIEPARLLSSLTGLFGRSLRSSGTLNSTQSARHLLIFMEFSEWAVGFIRQNEDNNDGENDDASSSVPSSSVKIASCIRKTMLGCFENFHNFNQLDVSDEQQFNKAITVILSRLLDMLDDKGKHQTAQDSYIDRLTLRTSIVNKLIYLSQDSQMQSKQASAVTIPLSGASNLCLIEFGQAYKQIITLLNSIGSEVSEFLSYKMTCFAHTHSFFVEILLSDSSLLGSPLGRLFSELKSSNALTWMNAKHNIECIKQLRETAMYFNLHETAAELIIFETLLLRFIEDLVTKQNQRDQLQDEVSSAGKEEDQLICERFIQLRLEENTQIYIACLLKICRKSERSEATRILSFVSANSVVNTVNEWRKNVLKHSSEVSSLKSTRKKRTNNKHGTSSTNGVLCESLKSFTQRIQLLQIENERRVGTRSHGSSDGLTQQQTPPHRITELIKFTEKVEKRLDRSCTMDTLLLSLRLHQVCSKHIQELCQSHIASTIIERVFRKLTAITFEKAQGLLTDIFASQQITSVKPSAYPSRITASSTEFNQYNSVTADRSVVSPLVICEYLGLITTSSNDHLGLCRNAQSLLVKSLKRFCKIQLQMNLFTSLKQYTKMLATISARFMLLDVFLLANCFVPSETEGETTTTKSTLIDIIQNVVSSSSSVAGIQLNSLFNRRKSSVAQMQISGFIKAVDQRLTSQTSSSQLMPHPQFLRVAMRYLISTFTSTVRTSHRNLETDVCCMMYFEKHKDFHTKNPLFCQLFSEIINIKAHETPSSTNVSHILSSEFVEHGVQHRNKESKRLKYLVLLQALSLLQKISVAREAKEEKETVKRLFVSLINFREICKLLLASFMQFDLRIAKQFSYLRVKFDEVLRDLLRESPAELVCVYKNLTAVRNCGCVQDTNRKAALIASNEEAFIYDSIEVDASYAYKQNTASKLGGTEESESISFEFKKLRMSIIGPRGGRKSEKDRRCSLARSLYDSHKKSKVNQLAMRASQLSKVKLKHDFILLNFLDYNNERGILIHKRSWATGQFTSFRITSSTHTDLFADLLNDVKRIFASNESEMKQEEKKRKSQVDSDLWWKSRNSNDKSLGKLLAQIANIFDFHTALFFGTSDETKDEELIDNLRRVLLSAEDYALTDSQDSELDILTSEKENLSEIISAVIRQTKTLKVSDIKFKSIYQHLCQHNIYLAFLGTQAQQYIQSEISHLREAYTSCVAGGETSNPPRPTLWMLSENIQQVPLESMPCFSDNNQTFYRIPSVDYLCKNYSDHRTVNFANNYYVLNPSGDLVNTQAKFQSKFDSIREWEGVSGLSVSSTHLQRVLQEYESYTYIGHGAGELYLSFKQIQEISQIKSAVLLFGCQSAKQAIQVHSTSPFYEVTGTSLYMLMSNCKLLIGSLYDITDRDTDRMVSKLISIFSKASKSNPIDFTQAFLQARAVCKLKHLNGSSFVTFGVPTSFYMK